MLQRFIKIILIVLILPSCGYTPIYSNLGTADININISSLNGDTDINNLILQDLKKFQNQDSEKKYETKIFSSYNKVPLTKDTAGNTTVYRLTVNIEFYTNIKKYEKMSFVQNFDMKKGDTEFDEEKYEKIIKRDMVKIIVQKFVSQIVVIK